MQEKEIREKILYHENEIKKLKELLKPFNSANAEKFADFQSRKIEKELLSKKEIEDNGNVFWNKNVVITGKFDNFQDRNIIARYLQENGAKIQSSINSKTDFAIIGKDAGPSKLKKVEELEINIINENDFLNIYNS